MLSISKKFSSEQNRNLGQFAMFGYEEENRNDYRTSLSPNFVKNQFQLFDKLNSKNLIKSDTTPLLWDCHRKAALPDSEVEYREIDVLELWLKLELGKYY